jgi:glycine betaine/proline transport system substrate-binding protein
VKSRTSHGKRRDCEARRNGRSSRLTRTAGLLAGVGLIIAACGWGSHRQNEDLTIGYIPWDEDVAVTYLWKHLLEQQGRTVKLTLLEMGPVFAGVARGDLDLFYDVWLPTTHKIYWDRYGDKVDKLVDWYDEAAVEWTVPAYVEDVDSIADLRGKSDEFDDAVIGIEAGAGLTEVSKYKVIPEYGLRGEYTVKTSSTPAMLEELKRSIDARRPIVVTLWHPHWAYSAFRLKDLRDPKGALGGTETLSVIGRRGFGDEFPEVTRWIKNFSMTDQQLASLEDEVRKAGDGNEAKGIDTWLQNNPDFPGTLGIPGS